MPCQISVTISYRRSDLLLDLGGVRRAIEIALSDAPFAGADIHVVVVDDATIHDLNRRFLGHNEPTDVLSFAMEDETDANEQRRIEGEIIVSADTAERVAGDFGWSREDELLLYVVHGTLHLIGYDDRTPSLKARMQAREREILASLGLFVPDGESFEKVSRPLPTQLQGQPIREAGI